MARYLDSVEYPTLKDALTSNYNVDTLRSLVTRAQLRPISNRKDDLIGSLIEFAHSLQSIDLLNEKEKFALSEAVNDPSGAFHNDRFVAKYGYSPYESQDGSWPKSYALDLYIVKGYVPRDLCDRFKSILPPPAQVTLQHLSELPKIVTLTNSSYKGEYGHDADLTIRETARAAILNLKSVLRLVDNGKIAVSAKTSRPSDASAQLITSVLVDGDWYEESQSFGAIQGFAWPLILKGAGFADLSDTKLKITSKGRKVLTNEIGLHDTLKTCWNSWLHKAPIDEFSRIETIKGQNSKGRVLTAPAGRREIIASVLKQCPCGKWVSITEFGRYMKACGQTFRVVNDLWKLYFCEQRYGSLGYKGHGGWNIVEQRYLQVFFMEFAATLGLLDIAYVKPDDAPNDYYGIWGTDDFSYLSRYDGLLYFRINSLGEYVLGMASEFCEPEIQVVAGLDILPNFDIIATDPGLLSPADRLYLSKISEQQTDIQWKLTQERLIAAAESGETCDSIFDYLQSHSRNEIPSTVSAFFREMKSKIIDLKLIGRPYLFRCDNPDHQAMIRLNPQLKKLCLYAGEDHFVILPGNEKKFFKQLNDGGFAVPNMRELAV